MKQKTKEHDELEVLVAAGIGLAFVGWLISVHLAGWLDVVGAAVGRFVSFVNGVAHVAVWLMPLVAGVVLLVVLGLRVWFPRRASDVLTKLLRLEEERPRVRRVWRRGACWRLAWRMPVGVTSEKVLERRTEIEQALDCSLRACWYERGLVRAEFGVARLPQRLSWRDFRRRVERRVRGMELPVLLGSSRVGPLVVDLAELPHMLIGGSTKGGKSTLLRQVITGLVMRLEPAALQLVLVDMKGGMEFNTFEGLPHLMCDVVSEVPDAEIELGRVLQEVERRQGLMRSAHVKSLREWNAKFPADRLPYIVVVVDEFAQFRPADAAHGSEERKGRQAVAARWQEIGRTGRALGVHVIACTQRPDAETITPQFKAQFGAKVAFYCADETNSRVVLDEAAAAALPPPWLTAGRAIWKGQASDLVEFQVPYLSDEDAVRLLSARYAPRVVEADFGPAETAAEPSGGGSVILIVAGTRLRNHLTGGAPGNPEAPVKVEAAGRRGRAEGRRGPAPRDPCRVERPALTGAGGFPTLSLLRWLRTSAPCGRRRSGGHAPRNTVPCMSKTGVWISGDLTRGVSTQLWLLARSPFVQRVVS